MNEVQQKSLETVKRRDNEGKYDRIEALQLAVELYKHKGGTTPFPPEEIIHYAKELVKFIEDGEE